MARENIPQNFVCDDCRLKKFKCSKERPSCALCLQHGRECVYSPRPERTPLTRQNLTAAEEKIRQLEAVIADLLPNVDLNGVLGLSEYDTPRSSETQEPVAKVTTGVNTPSMSHAKLRDSASPAAEEALPQQADGFDWFERETLSGLSDGMAALSIRPEGTGYLGATSSVVPLRALLTSDLGTEIPFQQFDGQNMNNINNMLFQIPSPAAPLQGASDHIFVDAYFSYYHTTYPFLHEPTFRAQYEGRLPQPKGNAWPILLNTVLALGAWCIGDESSTMDDAFYHEINRLSQETSIFEAGNLALVQALLLLSNYTQKRNKPNTGWNYLGLAIRMALSLGLHKEFPEWKISLLQREMRRRVWWGIVIFESGASITFGRPVLLPEDSIVDANEVLNIHEDSLTSTTTSLPENLSSPTIYTSLIYQTLFTRATNPLYHRLISVPPPSTTSLLSLQDSINDWESTLPSYFQLSNPALHQHEAFVLARYRLSWRAWNIRIISFRPIVLRWAARQWTNQNLGGDWQTDEDPEEEKCRLLCLGSARETIASISEYVAGNVPSRLGSWYMIYFLFQAALLPIIHLITIPTSPAAPTWLADMHTTKDLLSYAALSNRLAGRCLEVIDRLCAPLLEAEQPEAMLQDPRLFDDVHSMFVGEQGDGMEFMDWSSFGLQWGV